MYASSSSPALRRRPKALRFGSASTVGTPHLLTPSGEQWPPQLRPLSGTSGSGNRPSTTEVYRRARGQLRPSGSGSDAGGSGFGGTPLSSVRRAPSRSEKRSGAGAWLSPSSSRPYSSKLLDGVSGQIEAENLLSSERIISLDQQGRVENLPIVLPNAVLSDAWEADAFEHMITGLSANINDIQRRLQDFEPSSQQGSKDQEGARQQQQRKRESGDGNSEDEGERLAERLEAYKFVRKIESEPVPAFMPIDPGMALTRCDSAIIKQNAGSEELNRWTPSARRDRLEQCVARRQVRHEDAVASRLHFIHDSTQAFKSQIERKRVQGDAALVSQRSSAGRRALKPVVPCNELAMRWVTYILVSSYGQRLWEMLRVAKLPAQDPAQQSLDPFLEMCHAKMIENFRVLQCKTKRRCFVALQRRRAVVVAACLSNWKFSGRLITKLDFFAQRIRWLQRWWRDTARYLKRRRDEISARWERLEATCSLREFGEKVSTGKCPTPQSPKRTTLRPARTSAAARSNKDFIDEAVRLRFIEHELRARRFALLPAMQLYAADWQRWLEERTEPKKQEHMIWGIPRRDLFRWPPVKPTYLPQAHPDSEARGGACSDDCPGRRGDEEILKWVKACRENPEGWTAVPASRGVKLTRVGKPKPKSGSAPATKPGGDAHKGPSPQRDQRRRSRSDAVETSTPFVEVDEKDMLLWGVDAASMPGLSASTALD
mmetsp:Transcript_81906/g.228258  ORF Transcript_81906/g.228258 Transcript_81906/m.228258 type:complete len:715 (-) Transcript_81906:125-2269(-)